MKFTSSNSDSTYFEFSDVKVGRFCVDKLGDLLFKTSYNSSVRIATKSGKLCGKVFNDMSISWDIVKILPYDNVEDF